MSHDLNGFLNWACSGRYAYSACHLGAATHFGSQLKGPLGCTRRGSSTAARRQPCQDSIGRLHIQIGGPAAAVCGAVWDSHCIKWSACLLSLCCIPAEQALPCMLIQSGVQVSASKLQQLQTCSISRLQSQANTHWRLLTDANSLLIGLSDWLAGVLSAHGDEVLLQVLWEDS